MILSILAVACHREAGIDAAASPIPELKGEDALHEPCVPRCSYRRGVSCGSRHEYGGPAGRAGGR